MVLAPKSGPAEGWLFMGYLQTLCPQPAAPRARLFAPSSVEPARLRIPGRFCGVFPLSAVMGARCLPLLGSFEKFAPDLLPPAAAGAGMQSPSPD